MITLSELKTNLKLRTHPSGVPENLVAAYDTLVKEALIDAQRWITCAQLHNTQIYEFGATYWNCNCTVIESPRGRVHRVYTILTRNYCDRVFRVPVSYNRILFLAKWHGLVDAPANTGKPALPVPFKWSESSTDLRKGRARFGVYAIHNERIYLYPPLHSAESVVVEWDGLKRIWTDDDLVVEDPDFHRVIRLYVMKEFAKDYTKNQADYQNNTAEWLEARRDLIFECNEETRTRDIQWIDVPPFSDETCAYTSEFTGTGSSGGGSGPGGGDGTEGEAQFAIIGDYGNPDNETHEADVAEMVTGWEPDHIITTGDNVYGGHTAEDAILPFYGDYITQQISTNRFWPAVGNHDWNDFGIENFYATFALPNNERYYDIIRGGVHFIVLSSDAQEPDGNTFDSVQGEWCRLKLATSPMKWRVVICQDPPYSQHPTDYPGLTWMRWPFKEWGATVVVSGDFHAMARYEVDGFPYLVMGASGAPLMDSLNPGNELESYQRFLNNTDYGALKLTADCDRLLFEFFGVGEELLDSLEIT